MQSRLLSLISTSILLALFCYSPQLQADDEAANPIEYIPIQPSFITNYRAAKLGFLKADITLKVVDAETAAAVHRHLPSIRHQLVMLLSNQRQADINSNTGKQQLRQDALSEIIAVLSQENEAAEVQDVLFTSFIVE